MSNKLIIISNDQFYYDKSNFYCDHVAEKTLPDGLSDKFSITVIGRITNIKRFHKLKTKNVEHHSNLISYLLSIFKRKIKGDYKFLILSISPYTFFASLLFIFSKTKPIVYLRSDGHQEYKSILGFYGPFLYSLMFNITSKICFFISCREHILKKKPGKIVSPSELTNNWSQNIIKANFENIKLLYVGRVKVEKGIFSLLKLIKNNPSEISLTIVGENKHLESKINQKNVDIFPIENNEKSLIKFYDQHNIFVLPSYTEGHPMVLLEALARMRPVIIFEEIEHVIGSKKGIFVTRRESLSFFKTVNYIKKNYEAIYAEMKKNKLPTKNEFLKELEQLVLKLH
ncbi:glycosyltransferase family 4 protein [Pelagibacteraceae bacterium]|nr:glycosyltransferase family 4 protein [Pelagibacteraceae bacterium]